MKRLRSDRLSHLAYGETFPTQRQRAAQEAFEKEMDERIAKLKEDALRIPALDKAIDGGWGRGERYLIFGGTGTGRSQLEAQERNTRNT